MDIQKHTRKKTSYRKPKKHIHSAPGVGKMMDMRENLKDQKLVVYRFRKIGEEKTATAHSFIPKETDSKKSLISYFHYLNGFSKKEKINEELEFIEIIGEYEIKPIEKENNSAEQTESKSN